MLVAHSAEIISHQNLYQYFPIHNLVKVYGILGRTSSLYLAKVIKCECVSEDVAFNICSIFKTRRFTSNLMHIWGV